MKGKKLAVIMSCLLAVTTLFTFGQKHAARSETVSADGFASIVASSEETGHGVESAFDGDAKTYWQAQSDKADIVCDMGEVKSVKSYRQRFTKEDVWFFVVYGSVDGKLWATLADYATGGSGAVFSDSVSGAYRYVKIEFYGSEKGEKANSCEFAVDTAALSNGENVALGMKGYSGSWAAGFEHEKAFDGDTGSYYCANDGNYPQQCGVRWDYGVRVKKITVLLQDYGTYDFEVTAKKADGEIVTLLPRSTRTGVYYEFDADGVFTNIEYKVYGGPGWANLTELQVYGFRNFVADKCADGASEKSDNVYDLRGLAYVDEVTDGGEYMLSDDGENWVSPNECGNIARYLKTTVKPSAVYAMRIERDLAMGLLGAVSDYSNEGFSAEKATKNPEHEDGSNQFWCAATSGGVHDLTLDLGRECVVGKVVQTFQYEGAYKFKIEGSVDGVAYFTLADHTVEAKPGRTFEVAVNNKIVRFVRLTVVDCEWANSNRLAVYGVGSPLGESWWLRESGVVRYYPKKQKDKIADIIDKLDEYRRNGFKVIEIHQPYEGKGDIWAGLGATNNYQADPVNGTLDDWDTLLSEAHRRGMYVFMFGNVGYTRSTAEFFRKACTDYANGIESAEKNMFLFSDTCKDPSKWFWSDTAGAYYYGYWGENGQIPNYNFDNEAWRKECKRYIEYWADFGFDGIALDAPPAYYFGDADAPQVTYDNITHPLRARNIMILPEGTGDSNYIYSYGYSAVQNYNMGGWGGGAWSLGIDAVTDKNATTIDDFIKGGRDNTVSLGGASIAPLCFEQKYEHVEDFKRKAEAALLCTSGHMAFLHAGTDVFIGQDIIEQQSEDLQKEVYSLFKLQNGYSAFNTTGYRYRVRTNNDKVYYAYNKGDKSGNVKALCVFNYSGKRETISVDITNTGYEGTLIDLRTGDKYEIKDGIVQVTLDYGGYITLGEV